jgi:hypothetical protein
MFNAHFTYANNGKISMNIQVIVLFMTGLEVHIIAMQTARCMENSVLESIRRIIISLYAANLVNSSGEQGRKVMKETIADNGIGSRHMKKGICKNVRGRTAERLAHGSKRTQKGQGQPCVEGASSM